MCKSNLFREKGRESIPYEKEEYLNRQIYDLTAEIKELYYMIYELQFECRLKEQEINDVYDKMSVMAEIPKRDAERRRLRYFVNTVEKRRYRKYRNNGLLTDGINPLYRRDREHIGLLGRYDTYGYGPYRYDRVPLHSLRRSVIDDDERRCDDGR